MQARRRGLVLLLGASCVSIATVASATESSEPPVVDAAITASSPESDALVQALEEVATGLGLRMRFERRDAAPPDSSWPADVVAGVWIDARSPDHIDVRTTNVRRGAPPRSFSRSLTRDGSTAVVVEEVAEVVRAALESVQASRSEALPAASPPAPTVSSPLLSPLASPSTPDSQETKDAVAPDATRSGRGFGIDGIAFGVARAMSGRSSPVLGAGVAVDLSLGRVPLRPSLWISAAYGSRFDAQGGNVVFEAGATSLRLMPGIELLDLDAMQVDLDVGGGLDLFRVAPLVVRGAEAALGPVSYPVDPVAAAQLLMSLRLVPPVRLTFGFGVDYDLDVHSTAAPSGRTVSPRGSFAPWTVRPALALGLCIPLSSGGECANAR